MGKRRVERKSPVKAKPLRQAGQSTEERLRELIDDDLLIWVIGAVFAVTMAAIEWYRWKTDSGFHPAVITVFALLLVAYVFLKLRKWLPYVRNLKQGRIGEIAVGQYLDRLQEEGHRIFHDLVANNFNVDHVLIGTKGIYVIETKTFGKIPGQDNKVWFREGKLRVDGMTLDRDPVVQVQAAARWVSEIIKESTGKTLPVRPVLLFPGWFIEADNFDDVWVLEPKGLPKFLEGQADRMSVEDAKLATYHLSRFIRTS